jgi:TPR repeat protein
MSQPSFPNLQAVQTSAAEGDAEAQFSLAFTLAAGPAPQDYVQARVWYQKAADQDHRLAQFNLAQMFALGQGMPESDSMALMWFLRAATGGDSGAQYAMGNRFARACLHEPAQEAAESRIEAFKWFTLAATQNHSDALVRADRATMGMTREEVTEGNRRVKSFIAG